MPFLFFFAAREENVSTRVAKVLVCIAALSLTSKMQAKCTAVATLLLKRNTHHKVYLVWVRDTVEWEKKEYLGINRPLRWHYIPSFRWD